MREGLVSRGGPLRSGPKCGTDEVRQYKTHGIRDSIRAKCAKLFGVTWIDE